jgi:penicillin-binding protein 2
MNVNAPCKAQADVSRRGLPAMPAILLWWLRGMFAAAGIALAVSSVVLGQDTDQTLIRDRHGVVLVDPAGIAAGRQFPLEANAAQLLASLRDGTRSKAGIPLDLTLDARMQFIAERAMRAVPRGAAVVVDPRNGDVLAMASVPSFDPNALDATARAALEADPTRPLANRVLRAATPGSAFLPVTGLAGLRKGLARTAFNCAGGVTYGSKYLKCWIADKGGGHGTLRLDEALKASCGAFFYQYGNAVGIEEILATGKLLGLGAPSGLLPGDEDSGIVPGPGWLREHAPLDRWSNAHTANTAIGQGFTLTTPLQLAMVAATIGNGGSAYAPRLLSKEPVQLRADLRKEGWTPETMEIVRRGMWKTVNEGDGSGRRAQVPGVVVAGRTGTAQSWRQAGGENVSDNHTWFIGFAPYDAPTLAICVLVEGAKSGGGVAAPIAGRILVECLDAKAGLPVEALKPAKGSFEPVESVGN